MIDVARIKVKAGRGGDGKVHFRREKFVPKGGPDGGDGGNGGNVFFVADSNLATLMDFRSKLVHEAPDGVPGGENNKFGADGEDIRIRVPVGTLIYEIRQDEDMGDRKPREILVADLKTPGQEFLAVQGGKGGKGNTRFKSSTNVKPMQYTLGEEGEEKDIKLEIKLVADVGLIGLPNAGKSTLVNKLTNANAKVASYPFTTLSPNLGVCRLNNGKNIIISDIPGLIEGASEGKGLGGEFLRHVERTRVLVHVVDPLSLDPAISYAEHALASYDTIRRELTNYGASLKDKEEIIVINKLDVTEVSEGFSEIKTAFAERDLEVLGISAVSGEGLDTLLKQVLTVLDRIPDAPTFEVTTPTKMYTIDTLPNRRMVFGKDNVQVKDISEA